MVTGRERPAIVAMGSNLGDRVENLREAVRRLHADPDIAIDPALDTSPVYETAPIGGPPGQEMYLNAVVRAQTALSAREFLERLQRIETLLGRCRAVPNGPRTIDLDLLFYGQAVIDEPGLTVPHPRLMGRGFVLEPLSALAPDYLHPAVGLTARRLWEDHINATGCRPALPVIPAGRLLHDGPIAVEHQR